MDEAGSYKIFIIFSTPLSGHNLTKRNTFYAKLLSIRVKIFVKNP